jgi:hypothetical protein
VFEVAIDNRLSDIDKQILNNADNEVCQETVKLLSSSLTSVSLRGMTYQLFPPVAFALGYFDISGIFS